MSEKSHDATDKRLQEMRKQGQIARSQDVGRMVVLALLVEFLLGLRTEMFTLFQELHMLAFSRIGSDFALTGIDTAWFVARKVLMYSVCVVLLAAIIRIIADCLQFGWVFAPKALKINLDKLDPSKKLTQMFGKAQIWEFIDTLLKLSVLVIVGFFALQALFMPVMKIIYGTLDPIWEMVARIFSWQVRFSSLALILIAGVDLLMQKKMHRENARMDFQEIKQEMREGDGDPEAKMARRSMGEEWLNEEPNQGGIPNPSMDDALGEADLLLVNPTHIAVALSYRNGLHPLPVVIYKQAGKSALEFIRNAREKEIFIKRDPWLARHLFAHCPIGHPITHKAILPIAEYYRHHVLPAKPVTLSVLKKPAR